MSKRENSARISHVLGNYEIFDELGRGGMGIVYRGLDLSLDRPVAVKVLRDDLRMQPMIVSRFAREARAAASLDHPNIVQIYSVGETHGTPYIAMELVDSEPLSALMIREGKLPWKRAFGIAAQVAAALGSAHDAQIIHRDVKPPNILLSDKDKAYVTDFGIAKILSMHDQLTLDGTKLGTPQYMSPERCRTGDASAASDLYSLGVLLFQMISGRLPHEGNSATELVKRIISDPPARLRFFVPDVPEDVERLVAWCIETRPENRPASALVARDAMNRVCAGQRLDIRSSAVSRAIADFRGDTRVSKRRKPSTQRTAAAKPWQRLAPMWNSWTAVAVSAMVAILAGWSVSRFVSADEVVADTGQHEISNWYVPKSAASFLHEAENTWIAHLADPVPRIESIVWGDASQSFYVLTGSGDDASEVRRAVLAINPMTRAARAAAPRLNQRGAFVDLDRAGQPGIGFVGVSSELAVAQSAMLETGAQRDAAWVHDAIAGVVGNSRVGDVARCAFHPTESRLLFAVRDVSGGESLYEHGFGDSGRFIATAHSIGAIDYSADGTRYIYSLHDADGLVRAYAGITGGGEAPVLIWQGNTKLNLGAIHPDGQAIIVSNGHKSLSEIAFDGPLSERSLGAGMQPVWIDSNRLATIAPDTRGVTQIWEVSRDDGNSRRQISFIEGGIEGPLVVSSNGEWIAAIPRNGDRASVMLLNVTAD